MSAGLRVLFCDNHLLVVAKPAGMPAVPDASGDESLLDRAREWVRIEFAKPGAVFLGVVHRLDRPVSGVVVFARTSKSAARLAPQWRARTACKIYWGVCGAIPSAPAGACEQWLVKDRDANRVRIAPAGSADSKHAVTRWRVLEQRAGRALVELVPKTGRPHQLRVCAASLGAPLVGDLKYGAREPLDDASIALHARSVEFDHPTRGERMTFAAPVPDHRVWDFALCRESR